jgi:hypothetical protein
VTQLVTAALSGEGTLTAVPVYRVSVWTGTRWARVEPLVWTGGSWQPIPVTVTP